MIKTLFIVTTLFTCEYISAQKIQIDQQKAITLDNEQNRKAIGQHESTTHKAATGTYQFILTDQNHQFAVNDTFLVWIEDSRKETEDQFISIDENVTLFLPAKETIQKEDFKLLQDVTVKSH